LKNQIKGSEQYKRYRKLTSKIKSQSTANPWKTLADSTPGFKMTVQKFSEINQKIRCNRFIICFLFGMTFMAA
jgi:hypothetical protein